MKIEEMERKGIRPLAEKAWLATPTMHGEEMDWVRRAYETSIQGRGHQIQRRVV